MPIDLNHKIHIIAFCLIACAVNAEDGLQVLQQAESTMGSISFSAKFDYEDGDRIIKNELIQRKTEGGQYEYKENALVGSKSMPGFALTNVWLLNKNGFWQILPDEVLRMDFIKMDTNSAFVGLLGNEVNTSIEADYDTELKQVNGRELIVVSQKPRPLANTPLSKRAQIVERKIFVGRNDHIVYGCDLKRSDGTIAKITVTEFTSLNKVPDTVFELPAALPTAICSTSVRYSDIMLEKLHGLANTPAVKDAIQNSHKMNKKTHYAVISLMFIPTIFLAGFLLRDKLKKI